jgi:hypothetical protein
MRGWLRRRRRHSDARPRRTWRRRIGRAAGIVALVAILWPVVFVATQCAGSGTDATRPAPAFADTPDALREESYTFLTLPEWLIVYRADEYGQFIASDRPSAYPYLAAVSQYWGAYRAVCRVTRGHYPFQTGYHVMLGVIGVSFSAEMLVKSAYENTVGRVSEWLRSAPTAEDQWAAQTAKEYGAFLHTLPWYAFPFGARLGSLWSDTPLLGPGVLRKWERRLALTAEYGFKAVYGWVLGAATQSTYGAESLEVLAHVTATPRGGLGELPLVTVRDLGDGTSIVRLPRYEAFTHAALMFIDRGGRFASIAGNDEMLLTGLVSTTVAVPPAPAQVIAALPLLVEPGRTRLALRVPLASLADTIAWLRGQGGTVEHLYDY